MVTGTRALESPMLMPYLTGVYLAVNAIPDAYLVVDGPNCVFFRISQIQGNHDWKSTLASCSGFHRIADTDCTTERAAVGDHRLLVSRLLEVSARSDCNLILLTAMSPVAVTGRQYGKIIQELGSRLTKPVVLIPAGSLTGDWLDGYSASLESLAEELSLPPDVHPDADSVALVGYLMDRNEADHQSNLRELRHLLAGLSLRMCSGWLDGQGTEHLRQVAAAGTILSFPYGCKAARTLARRTGARLIECELPFGLEGTSSWLRQIGGELGKSAEAEATIERELRQVVPALEWILPHALLGKRLALLGSDPVLLGGVCRVVTELGCRIALRSCWSTRVPDASIRSGTDQEWHQNLDETEFHELINRQEAGGEGIDAVITNSRCLGLITGRPGHPAIVELGFPSYHWHALVDSPCLGFRGTLSLVERIANAISLSSLPISHRPG
jgi:nitrogenase molybdenum-iron protein alpha/beta subunit